MKKSPYTKKSNLIFFCFIIAALSFSIYKNHIYSAFENIFPPEIKSSYDTSLILNENSQFKLPSKINAYYKYGKNKSTNIIWQSRYLDTSNPGNKVILGNIQGYSKEIKFSANVLPHKINNEIEDCTVSNSTVEFKAIIQGKYKYIWFKVSKGLESKDYLFPITNGQVNSKIYLPFGKGEYYISVLTNSDGNENGLYYPYKSITVFNEDSRDTEFLLPDKYVESDSEEITELATSIVIGLKTNFEKTKAIHDWVASNIAYDTDAYFSDNVREYSSLETLKSKKALCNGYANLTAALNRAVGVKCKIIGGTAWDSDSKSRKEQESHAWNETLIDGKWIIQDTTWDAGSVNMKKKKFHFELSHKYFNPSTNKFSKDHLKTSEK